MIGGAQIGVMMEGAESSWIGFPGTTDLDYLRSHGVSLVRLPISWELMQNTLNGPLNSSYLSGLETFLSEAAQRDFTPGVDKLEYIGSAEDGNRTAEIRRELGNAVVTTGHDHVVLTGVDMHQLQPHDLSNLLV